MTADWEALVGRRTTASVVGLVGVTLAVTGCGSTTDGSPTSSAADVSAVTAALWDPCTQVSDEVLQQLGMDLSTRGAGVADVQEPGWKVCSWNNAEFNLGISATIHSTQDLDARPDNVDSTVVSFNGRGGVQHRRKSEKYGPTCEMAFPSGQGLVVVTTSNRATSENAADSCAHTRSAAKMLTPVFPR
ncbi:DUF3558 domain-containing protein [Nocardia australiensis]|uniref:DUF3558 domain-containing protein n=1 Tax=Nocardia australiensis TaxID=2887191 RepID=UPI001D14E8C7|nr:DUF3558 family protein [Nocardia australiensis]